MNGSECAREYADAYWVVVVDRGTGGVSTSLVQGENAADRAHAEAARWNEGSTFATVVGKR